MSMLKIKNMYIPLINNLIKPLYNSIIVKLGETPEHFAARPTLVKINSKLKIYGVAIGASTPSQIANALIKLIDPLKNVKLINGCTGAQDVNDWLNPSGKAWSNLTTALNKAKIAYNDVQFILMCQEDLLDNENDFPGAAHRLENKVRSIVQLAKSKFPNLKQIDFECRGCEYFIDPIAYAKFKTPSGYHNGWANKFLIESTFTTNHLLTGVWLTDATAYIWTDGSGVVRSDGFVWNKEDMQLGGTSVHFDTSKLGDENAATYIFNNFKRYNWFN